MTVATNPITGDEIKTKIITEQYRNNYDLIFSKKSKDVLQSQIIENDIHDKSV